MKRLLLLTTVLMMLITAVRGNEIVTLHVTRVVDGDTFEGYVGNGSGSALNQITVRINGIDAPERGQNYGDVAAAFLHRCICGKTVQLELVQKDRYGRWVAKVSLEGVDVAGEMLKNGLAWYYKEYENNPRYAQLEAGARLRRLGLWNDDRAVAPWEWRKMSRAERDLYR